ncbi:hypothetical protein PR202_ga05744 [Eleusine coracana subsp. coracana]|uniref:Uncharacterized protein n=1 Tax=Eleusine coracana subsp. coracana TaxID=191504 RepID=A0AAV5BUG5_ELECO|nr:hypothetical protein PR202_ga05744 [Eleusine coracana subsp. coracana]
MGSPRGRGIRGKTSLPMQPVLPAVLVLCLILSRCSPCEGRKLPVAEGEDGGKVLRVPPPPSSGEEAMPRGFTTRAERSMRSVPSPGVGH